MTRKMIELKEVKRLIKKFEKEYDDMTAMYNKIILFAIDNYRILSKEDLDYIDEYLMTHAYSIRTRVSIYRFVPRKEDSNEGFSSCYSKDVRTS